MVAADEVVSQHHPHHGQPVERASIAQRLHLDGRDKAQRDLARGHSDHVGGSVCAGGIPAVDRHPHRAVAKMDFRLVPDMSASDSLQKLKAHLQKRGFGDIEVNMTGGNDPTTTSPDAPVIQSQIKTYRAAGYDPLLWPRNGGSWPGYVFTGEPLKLAAGHFGLGHGSGAHAPDEYFVVESTNPNFQGLDGAVRSFVDYLYELAG